MRLSLKWIFVVLYLAYGCNAFVKYAVRENKQNGQRDDECFLSGGYCISEQHCLNGIKMNSKCGNSSNTICCLPSKIKAKCLLEKCDGLVQDCSQDERFRRFNPLVCGPIKRCGMTNETYHKVCRRTPSLQIVCCAEETVIIKASNGYQTLEVAPNGEIEGILYDQRYVEYEAWDRQFGQIPLILAVVCVMIALFLLSIIFYIIFKQVSRNRVTNILPTNVNRDVRLNLKMF